MPESQSRAAHGHRRANWVALRTLRQRPRVVDTTSVGEAVFEVRSVRLVLRAESPHFNRLVPCSKCGSEVSGPPVLHVGDLDRTPSAVICSTCVKASGSSVIARSEERRSSTQRFNPPPAVDSRATGSSPLAAEEARSEVVPDSPAEVAETAVRDGLAEARAEIAWLVETTAARLATVEAQISQRLDGMARLVDAQRAEMAAVSKSVADARAQIEQVAEAHLRLARAQQQEFDRRLTDVAARAEGRQAQVDGRAEVLEAAIEAGERRLQALEHRTHEALRALVERLDRGPAAAPSVEPGVGGLADALDAQLRAAESRLAEKAAGQQVDLLIEPRPAPAQPGDGMQSEHPRGNGVVAGLPLPGHGGP